MRIIIYPVVQIDHMLQQKCIYVSVRVFLFFFSSFFPPVFVCTKPIYKGVGCLSFKQRTFFLLSILHNFPCMKYSTLIPLHMMYCLSWYNLIELQYFSWNQSLQICCQFVLLKLSVCLIKGVLANGQGGPNKMILKLYFGINLIKNTMKHTINRSMCV